MGAVLSNIALPMSSDTRFAPWVQRGWQQPYGQGTRSYYGLASQMYRGEPK